MEAPVIEKSLIASGGAARNSAVVDLERRRLVLHASWTTPKAS
jgi:hypothetical protein